MAKLKAVVLAAGKGTRIDTGEGDVPKVMRKACGKPLLWYVLNELSFIDKKDIILVVGYKKEEVIKCFNEYEYSVQTEQLGTGHAVMAAKNKLTGYDGALLVCYGDMPAIPGEVYKDLYQTHIKDSNDCTLLSGESSMQMSFGRVLRDENGMFSHVVEEKDCTAQQLNITELNTGVYIFNTPMLISVLSELKNDNSQREYYLTDVPLLMKEKAAKIGILKCDLGDNMIGVNTLAELEMVERILSNRQSII